MSDVTEHQLDLGDLPGRLGYMLRRAQLVVFADFYARFEALELRPTEYSTLVIVDRNPGVRLGQVADALGVLRPNLAVVLQRLTARNLIERRAHPADRRGTGLHMTSAGRTLLCRARAAVTEHESRWLDLLGAERHGTLIDMLRVVVAAP